MGLLAWIIFGMIVGWCAGKVMGSQATSMLGDFLLGAMGAVVGGLLAAVLMGNMGSIEDLNFLTILFACAGAVVMVVFVKVMNGSHVTAVD